MPLPLIAFVVGCLGSGGGVADGAATIRGVIVEYEEGNVADVAVSVEGTDLLFTTGPDGFFVLSGVPPGSRKVVFAKDSSQAAIDLDVPQGGLIELKNVRVRGGRAKSDEIIEHSRDDADRETDEDEVKSHDSSNGDDHEKDHADDENDQDSDDDNDDDS